MRHLSVEGCESRRSEVSSSPALAADFSCGVLSWK